MLQSLGLPQLLDNCTSAMISVRERERERGGGEKGKEMRRGGEFPCVRIHSFLLLGDEKEGGGEFPCVLYTNPFLLLGGEKEGGGEFPCVCILTHSCCWAVRRKVCGNMQGFIQRGGRTGSFPPPSLSSPPPPEILKFSMVFGQDCVRSNLRRSKNQKISFGDMPPDPSRLLAR